MSNDALTQYVAEHPKLISVLFTVFVLLSQAGAVAAAGIRGP